MLALLDLTTPADESQPTEKSFTHILNFLQRLSRNQQSWRYKSGVIKKSFGQLWDVVKYTSNEISNKH